MAESENDIEQIQQEIDAFEKFLADNGISKDTVIWLMTNGFIDTTSLYAMEIADIQTMKVKQLGQRRLLRNF